MFLIFILCYFCVPIKHGLLTVFPFLADLNCFHSNSFYSILALLYFIAILSFCLKWIFPSFKYIPGQTLFKVSNKDSKTISVSLMGTLNSVCLMLFVFFILIWNFICYFTLNIYIYIYIYIYIKFIESQNSSINLRLKLGDVILCLQHRRFNLKHYQTFKVIRLKIRKIKLSVTMCFVSAFLKTKLRSGFCLTLSLWRSLS